MVYAPSVFSHGTYFGLARWGDAGERCGYVAIQDYGEFRECEIPLEELKALEKPLKAISIPLGSSVCALDGGSGLIRIYHGHEGWIDFFYRNIEQPQWDPLLAFIHETTERFVPAGLKHSLGGPCTEKRKVSETICTSNAAAVHRYRIANHT